MKAVTRLDVLFLAQITFRTLAEEAIVSARIERAVPFEVLAPPQQVK